jgi:hypothetical protein
MILLDKISLFGLAGELDVERAKCSSQGEQGVNVLLSALLTILSLCHTSSDVSTATEASYKCLHMLIFFMLAVP